ncbi:hypothetical protein ScPMuIL_010530 [Solemya velum]
MYRSGELCMMVFLTCVALAVTQEGDRLSSSVRSLINTIRSNIDNLEKELETEGLICTDKDHVKPPGNTVTGAVYTRWGRTTCQENRTELVYNGFTPIRIFRTAVVRRTSSACQWNRCGRISTTLSQTASEMYSSGELYVLVFLTCVALVVTQEGDKLSSSVRLLINTIRSNIDSLEKELETEGLMCTDNDHVKTPDDTVTGAVYTRWGRTSCPENGTELVYNGFTANSHFMHGGGASNFLCLPMEPVWADFDDALSSIGGSLHGTEYEEDSRSSRLFGENLKQQNAPCAVCQSMQHKNVLMIPGRTSCFGTWSREYTGYLMTGHWKHDASHEFICVDAKPETVIGQAANVNGALLYFVEIRCDSLACPPYVNGREVPCVVCTN